MKVAIIQARTGSTRLPGKVLKTLGTESIISQLYQRIKQCRLLDDVVIAMPEGAEDDALAQHVANFCPSTARGSEKDVLDRYMTAADQFGAQTIVRITSDCPFFDPDILDQMLAAFDHDGPDYMSNTIDPHLPRGLDAEVFTIDALRRAHNSATAPHEREHVTPYIYQHPELFSVKGFRIDGNWADLRWTLDTEKDWSLIQRMYDLLEVSYQEARLPDFLAVIKAHPELREINASVKQKTLDE
ncbi:cytidylyltransferase domain-containing protein [Aliiroseovarius lamellibrachiae]|uniref:cytidylyltransferase domain-containing protein n=1 Tax=Aliiroseovarius lamellibrachiae TaxID=1924933 RepID=UPI001BDF9EFA|nr:glycosyltransferase family protein [Aliiroseovarius lamellibrachiae]MBT2131515.1 glycosyltransferase family protein [Aliiroseovarius lamellibrachiae]